MNAHQLVAFAAVVSMLVPSASMAQSRRPRLRRNTDAQGSNELEAQPEQTPRPAIARGGGGAQERASVRLHARAIA